MMDPKKPFRERPTDEHRTKEELDTENAVDKNKDDTPTDVDEVIDKESYTERNHGRTHDGSADVSNPGTV